MPRRGRRNQKAAEAASANRASAALRRAASVDAQTRSACIVVVASKPGGRRRYTLRLAAAVGKRSSAITWRAARGVLVGIRNGMARGGKNETAANVGRRGVWRARGEKSSIRWCAASGYRLARLRRRVSGCAANDASCAEMLMVLWRRKTAASGAAQRGARGAFASAAAGDGAAALAASSRSAWRHGSGIASARWRPRRRKTCDCKCFRAGRARLERRVVRRRGGWRRPYTAMAFGGGIGMVAFLGDAGVRHHRSSSAVNLINHKRHCISGA